MKYIVLELQKNADGSVGNLVFAYDDQEHAESKYHQVLAAAAVSALPAHSAVLMNEEGFVLSRMCYKH